MGNSVLIVEPNQIIAELIAKSIEETHEMSVVIALSKHQAMKELLTSERFFLAIVANSTDDSAPEELVELVHRKKLSTIILVTSEHHLLSDHIDMRYVVGTSWKNRHHDIEYIVRTVKHISSNRNFSILIVDESAPVRMLLERQLMAQQFRVLTAKSGAEALLVMQEEPISVVLTEYRMEEMDGLVLTRLLRQNHTIEELAIIVVSAEDDSEVTVNLLRQGVNEFIPKPWVHEVLDSRVNNTVRALEMYQRLTDVANRDYLTNHYNRRYFFTELDKTDSRKISQRIVVMMDLDKFKSVNDTYGHDVGDIVLRRFADILRETIGFSGLVGRVGGEEFTVLFCGKELSEVLPILENMRKTVEKEVVSFDGGSLNFTVSTGVCCESLRSGQAMLKRADELLYKAKTTGRNKVVTE